MQSQHLEHVTGRMVDDVSNEMNRPFSHWDAAYEGAPPWDIGIPQDEFVRLAEKGEIEGCVLDIGCGTGENALHFARLGHEVWGIDISQIAIQKARGKAAMRGLHAHFMVRDALNLSAIGHSFNTVTDCGFFHTLDDDDRSIFLHSLSSVLLPGGTYFMLAMSEKEPTDWGGPRRISQKEIKEAFRDGWRINYIRDAKFRANLDKDTPLAWLSSITKE